MGTDSFKNSYFPKKERISTADDSLTIEYNLSTSAKKGNRRRPQHPGCNSAGRPTGTCSRGEEFSETAQIALPVGNARTPLQMTPESGKCCDSEPINHLDSTITALNEGLRNTVFIDAVRF